ncbi:sodium-dependent glucose transporter 1-like protein [Dinothrombium tinctorium]|uniref:Sodium-dependent glucose transporter 1-like protein n=1 Tax=Dinothrombium tinctorium TaxID=1965070 RepID=A0A443QT79_9ACAR|nr:sodium-dependent glucose transporter 1-like protein [Dinothrombium tinctorium]
MSVYSEIKIHKFRFLKTLVLFLIFVVHGLIAALPGVTLLDLQIAVNAPTVEQISYVIPFRAGGHTIGSLLNAILVHFFDHQLCLFTALTAAVALIATVPWNRTLIGMYSNMFFIGIPTGILDSGGNVWLLHLWGKANPPFMQALHFFSTFGKFVAPLISEPFLLPLQKEVSTSLANTTDYKRGKTYTPDDLKIPYTYGIVSLFGLCVLIMFLVVYLIKRDNKPHPSREEKEHDKQANARVPKSTNACIIIFTCLFMLIFSGLEYVFGNLLPTFAVLCDLKFNKSKAAFIASLYYGTFTFFRVFAIFLLDLIGSQNLILFDLILITVANVLLVPFGNRFEWCLWTGVAIMGCGASSVFGAIFGFLEDFVNVKSKFASLILINVCFGAFAFPLIVGKYADTEPLVFLYISLLCNLLCCICFIVLMCLKRFVLKVKNVAPELHVHTVKS